MILVTGATGLSGSFVVHELQRRATQDSERALQLIHCDRRLQDAPLAGKLDRADRQQSAALRQGT